MGINMILKTIVSIFARNLRERKDIRSVKPLQYQVRQTFFD